MMADGGGRIVNVSSIVGFTGYSGLSVYGATKASMIGFTRSLAREVGRLGITVNAVAPGFMDTEMTQGLGDEQREQVARRSALRRLAEVDDVANAVEFLLGDKAAEHHRHGADGRRRQHGVDAARPHLGRCLDALESSAASSRTNAAAAAIVEIDRVHRVSARIVSPRAPDRSSSCLKVAVDLDAPRRMRRNSGRA